MNTDGESSPAVGTSDEQEESPEGPRPPRSAVAAALLNLTGLGLGYAYSNRWWPAGLSALGTALLLTGGLLLDAASAPWLWRGIALGWLGLVGAHAGWLARRHPRPVTARSRWLPVAAGVVAVAAVVAGYTGYTVAGHAAYSAGLAAQARADCATAVDRLDAVTGPYELTLSGEVTAAADRRAECAAFLRATTARERGDHDAAVEHYRAFGRDFPHSVLTPFVHTNLAEAYVDDARGRTEPFAMPAGREAVDTLLMVRREFDDTPSAAKALDAIADAFAAAEVPYARGRFCDALPALTFFAGLDPSSAGAVVDSANANRATALLRCGLQQLRSGDAGTAATTLDTFVLAYPGHRAAPQARSALITARIAEQANVTLPVPPPLGGNSPGTLAVTFYNDARSELRLLLAGPTAHEVVLPACGTCPVDYPKGAWACPTYAGRPSVTLRLKSGKYHYLPLREDPMIETQANSFTLKPGAGQLVCMYVERLT